MGQKVSHKTNEEPAKIRQSQIQPLSDFYIACREGDIEKVKNHLSTMSLEQINNFESNGSTALHASSYYGHTEIVRLLLTAGACRSIRNLRYRLTAYDEASNEDVQQLFSHIYSPAQARFIGSSARTEWSLDTSQAAEWKIHLSKLLKPELSFQDIILYLKDNYLTEYVNLPPNQLEKITSLFHYAYEYDDASYILRAYTTGTPFHGIINNHLAEYLLKYFRFDNDQSVLEQCVAHLASICIHRPELKSLEFTGIVYRGLFLLQSDLKAYTVGKHLLNKSFLSTTTDLSVASMYAGAGTRINMRTAIDKTPLQYTALCIYRIKNKNTALDISSISEIPDECEVIIMPLCAFQVRSVKKNIQDNNCIQYEIELEECENSPKINTKKYQQGLKPRVT
ncbi:unnamed protein product [Adineta steineri]|uniref:NAD(+)--protein-arginine ADP-ribosyltransferase n=1 Tax=Adineta steineri TaxID=433720 RepID=A0A819V6T4_9BILA|nr:unnamed protein product [Adineta steineri]